jgi:hypothetical protein
MDQKLEQDLIASTHWNDQLEKSCYTFELISKNELDRIKVKPEKTTNCQYFFTKTCLASYTWN